MARVSYGTLLHRQAMERFGEALGSLAAELPKGVKSGHPTEGAA